MLRIDTGLERALLAAAVAAATVLLLTVPGGEPIPSGAVLPIAVAVGVAVYASEDDCSGSCGCADRD